MFTFLMETLALGMKNLRLHKLRSLLTALGIIIGIIAVIVMVSIGEGAKAAAAKQMAELGARNIVVRSVKPPSTDEATGRTSRVAEYGLKRLDYDRLAKLPNVRLIVPVKDTEQKVIRGSVRFNVASIATHPALFEVINLRLERGRLLNQLDYDSAATVCVLGAQAARDLFPREDPIGQVIQVGTSGQSAVLLTVVGVLEPTGIRSSTPGGGGNGGGGGSGKGVANRDYNRDLYFPLSLSRLAFGDSIFKREPGSVDRRNIELSEAWLQVNDIGMVEPVMQMARSVVAANPVHRVNDVDVLAPLDILRSAERLNRLFNFILVGIASFSLVVGGIGIMNIMLATVTERTKEIGIRRALGAKRSHITLQFLIETTVISMTGGFLGVLLGCGSALLLPVLVALVGGDDYPTQIAAWSVIGSFVLSGLIGIGFGLYPAIQAARMNPIEALRHE